jgi:hypothetical protein
MTGLVERLRAKHVGFSLKISAIKAKIVGTAKQWWALQQLHIFNFRTWIMIDIDQLHYLQISWHS